MQRAWFLAHSCARYYVTTEQTPSLSIAANSAIWTKALHRSLFQLHLVSPQKQ